MSAGWPTLFEDGGLVGVRIDNGGNMAINSTSVNGEVV